MSIKEITMSSTIKISTFLHLFSSGEVERIKREKDCKVGNVRGNKNRKQKNQNITSSGFMLAVDLKNLSRNDPSTEVES